MQLDPMWVSSPPIENSLIANHFSRFPLYVREHTMRYHCKSRHTQPGIEITLSHTGRASYVVGSRVYSQNAGSLTIVRGRHPHQMFIDPTMKYRRTILCIDDQGIREQVGYGQNRLLDMEWLWETEWLQLTLQPALFTELTQHTRKIGEELKRRSSGWCSMALARLLEVSVLLQRAAERQAEGSGDNLVIADLRGLRGEELVATCCRYVADCLAEELSLQRVAKQFAVSPEHLTRLFRERRGVSYYRYVLGERIGEGQRLLRMFPQMSITDVAGQVGFSSSIQFSRMFKSCTGLTPTEYRERCSSRT